jgi:hypothetical protein
MERSTVQSCLAAPVFLSQKAPNCRINQRFGLVGAARVESTISAISARTNGETVCQLTQNWHNRSSFVSDVFQGVHLAKCRGHADAALEPFGNYKKIA